MYNVILAVVLYTIYRINNENEKCNRAHFIKKLLIACVCICV